VSCRSRFPCLNNEWHDLQAKPGRAQRLRRAKGRPTRIAPGKTAALLDGGPTAGASTDSAAGPLLATGQPRVAAGIITIRLQVLLNRLEHGLQTWPPGRGHQRGSTASSGPISQPRAGPSARQLRIAAKPGHPSLRPSGRWALPNSVEALPEGGSLGGRPRPPEPWHRRMKSPLPRLWVAPCQLDPGLLPSPLWALSAEMTSQGIGLWSRRDWIQMPCFLGAVLGAFWAVGRRKRIKKMIAADRNETFSWVKRLCSRSWPV